MVRSFISRVQTLPLASQYEILVTVIWCLLDCGDFWRWIGISHWNFNAQSRLHLWKNYLQVSPSGFFNLLFFSLCNKTLENFSFCILLSFNRVWMYLSQVYILVIIHILLCCLLTCRSCGTAAVVAEMSCLTTPRGDPIAQPKLVFDLMTWRGKIGLSKYLKLIKLDKKNCEHFSSTVVALVCLSLLPLSAEVCLRNALSVFSSGTGWKSGACGRIQE